MLQKYYNLQRICSALSDFYDWVGQGGGVRRPSGKGWEARDQPVLWNSWIFFPSPSILNDILLLKILFSGIGRAPEGEQVSLYLPGLGRKPQCTLIFKDGSSLTRFSFHIINMTAVLVTYFKFNLFTFPMH